MLGGGRVSRDADMWVPARATTEGLRCGGAFRGARLRGRPIHGDAGYFLAGSRLQIMSNSFEFRLRTLVLATFDRIFRISFPESA